MAGRIPRVFINDLLARTDIVDLIDARVKLKKQGKNFHACCPFHNEKTPSFTVNGEKQFYHCFGCGAHGNAIDFLMNYDKLEFVETVEELAAMHNLEVPFEAGSGPSQIERHQRQTLYQLMDGLNTFYQQSLQQPVAMSARQYLEKRGLSHEVIARFAIGFAPPGWDNVLKRFGGNPENRQSLIDAGMLVTNDQGRSYDRFRERVMFPIRDKRGRVIGFGGRVLGNDTPKYLNSPETDIFHKGRQLYGLYEAQQDNAEPNRLLVVEGYMDVVALAGTPNSVCAAVLRFREGRLTDKREFLFHDTADIAAAREEFLPRYYLDDEQIPKVIAVDELPPDSDALQQALTDKRGSEVQLYVPQRGDKAHLIEMAHTNAVERLARESGRYAREEKLLDELAQVLGLAKPPRAIESYDISNWGDGSSVCGMVTFKDGKPYKAGYRRFKMKTVAGTDDYASLAETVSRRAAEYEKYAELAKKGEPCSNWFGQKPDLLLMDGGRGQVSAAKDALAGTALADVPLYGMVKDDHHRTRAIVDSDGREIAINMNRGTFTFITAIQDETHRFANAYRKQQMKQKSYSSTLTEIPGIGPKTAKALMAQFKSVGAVKEATPDQLENTPGVGKQTAQTIYEYFHE